MGRVDNKVGRNEGCGTPWSEEAVWIKALEGQGGENTRACIGIERHSRGVRYGLCV
jgi:hypothetical protein